VLDAYTQAVVQDLFRRESRSLLQYLSESFPWTAPEYQDAVSQLGRLAEEERTGIARIARFLQRRHVPLPYLGAFPEEFTSINFIGLDYALARLVKRQRRAIAEWEADLRRLTEPEARALVEELLAEKQRHLKELEALAGAQPATTVR
jgi:hypothetical protein